jgi:hypothetical protein
MREIVLYPGESITIGDTIVRTEHRSGQFINPRKTLPVLPTIPEFPKEVPGTPAPTYPGWPVIPPSTTWCKSDDQ